eukprot:TRINITY_DN1120_c0_g1_i2.p1 TRINITY_DN1120_c0_g1~~TRINITY_DN1120_c0_g1_i2.p1  ORF type:complete len:439 (+),score=70.91 TRINITY_DN1120_c0_g1_i2:918-2234(+)
MSGTSTSIRAPSATSPLPMQDSDFDAASPAPLQASQLDLSLQQLQLLQQQEEEQAQQPRYSRKTRSDPFPDYPAISAENDREQYDPDRPATHGVRYQADTSEMAFWRNKFWWVSPSPMTLAGLLNIVPMSNLALFSTDYQMYLVAIFHTQTLTRLAHWICTPLITLFLLASFAMIPINWDLPNYEFNNCSIFAAIFLLAWHLIWAALDDFTLVGMFMIPIHYCLWLSANVYIEKIYDSEVWYLHPVALTALFGFFQTMSHAFEVGFPPRANGGYHWRTFIGFCSYKWYYTFLNVPLFFVAFLSEIIAAPKLIFLHTLRVCFHLGYKIDERESLDQMTTRALRSGNPAIDYIGSGGSLPPQPTTAITRVPRFGKLLLKSSPSPLSSPSSLMLSPKKQLLHRSTDAASTVSVAVAVDDLITGFKRNAGGIRHRRSPSARV